MKIELLPLDRDSAQSVLSGSNLFLQLHWLNLYGSSANIHGVYKGAELLAVFHTYSYKRFGNPFLINTPMAPHCGFQLQRSAEGTYASQTETKRILRTLAEYLAEKAKKTYVDIALPVGLIDVQPFIWKELSVTPKYTYLLDCTLHESALLANMSAERRKNIRDAEKAGYEIQINQKADDALLLVSDTLRRAGEIPKESELKKILAHENDFWRFWIVISRNGIPLAAAVIGYDAHRAYYLAGGHNHASADSLAGTWALWNGITEAKRRALPSFDFLGSSVPSIEQYFRGFGGTLTPYFRIGGGHGFTGILKTLKKKLVK